MLGNFLNMVKEIDMQFQEAHRVSNKMNPKKPTSRHIAIKMQKFKDKERILKSERQKPLSCTTELVTF